MSIDRKIQIALAVAFVILFSMYISRVKMHERDMQRRRIELLDADRDYRELEAHALKLERENDRLRKSK